MFGRRGGAGSAGTGSTGGKADLAPRPAAAPGPAQRPASAGSPAPQRQTSAPADPNAPLPPGKANERPRSEEYYDIKSSIFSALIDTIDLSQLALYVAAALLLAVTPGPGIFYVAARSLAGGRAEGIAREHAVQVGPHDPPVRRPRALWLARDMGEGPGAIGAPGPADVDLIALHRGATGRIDRLNPRQPLVRAHLRLDLQQAKPRRLTRRTFKPLRVTHHTPQHLVAATDPQDPAPPPHMGRQIHVPALRAQERQIAARRFRAGNDDQIHVARQRLSGADHGQPRARLCPKRVQVVEIRDA